MLMKKKGLIGKIFICIGIIILVVGVIIGFTAYQTYDLYKTIMNEQPNIENNAEALQRGDCSKIPEINISIEKIKSKAESACKNPIIRYTVEKMQQVPVKCDKLSTIETQIQVDLSKLREACANLTAQNRSNFSTLPPFPSA